MRIKRILQTALAATAALCIAAICSCVSKPDADYTNSYYGCEIGDTIYSNKYGNITIYNANFGSVSGLCRDPLCTHDSADSLCPQSFYFLHYSNCVTDGRMLYFAAANSLAERLEDGRIVYEIYAYDPETASLKRLCSGGASSNAFGKIAYNGGYIYYAEGFYNEDFDRSSGHVTSDDQYIRFMRVKTSGGSPESLFDETFAVGSDICVDEYHYYVIKPSDKKITARSRADGSETAIDLGEYSYLNAVAYGGKIYIWCLGEINPVTFSSTYDITLTAILAYDPVSGELTVAANRIFGGAVLSGGELWYSTAMSEPELYGTKDMPTGRGGETAPFDFFRINSGNIVRLDLSTGEKQEWNAGGDEYGQLEPDIIGWSDGCLLATLYSGRKQYETGETDRTIYKLTLDDDGTVTAAGSLTAETDG